MTMHGFDTKFKTFPDYILGITHEIWEERGIDTLNHYYSPDILVRSPQWHYQGQPNRYHRHTGDAERISRPPVIG